MSFCALPLTVSARRAPATRANTGQGIYRKNCHKHRRGRIDRPVRASTSIPTAFDVASVKARASSHSKAGRGIFLPGRVEFPKGSLKLFYHGSISGSRRDDPQGTRRGWILSASTLSPKPLPRRMKRGCERCCRALVAERFKLVAPADRVVPEYELMIGRNEPKAGAIAPAWRANHDLRRTARNCLGPTPTKVTRRVYEKPAGNLQVTRRKHNIENGFRRSY
jgi:uncharacterized protein (TIGR03435 family)